VSTSFDLSLIGNDFLNKVMSEFHTTTSVWTENIESVLSQIHKTCISYKWMSIATSKRNEMKYNVLMYISIVIGPLSGILSVFSESQTTGMFVTVFSFMSGVISAVIKFSEFGEKAALYKTIAAKYSSLQNNINRQLSLNKEDRVNAGEYLEWISRSYDELFSATPLIPDDIYHKFVDNKVVNNEDYTKKNSDVKVESNKVEHQLNMTIENGENKFATSHSIDFGQYSDGKMRYELARLAKS
jgi:hypothetical protein